MIFSNCLTLLYLLSQATALRHNKEYIRWYSCITTLIVMNITPTVVLIFTSYKVCSLLNSAGAGLSDEKSKARAKRNKSITRMLIMIIIIFLICHIGKVSYSILIDNRAGLSNRQKSFLILVPNFIIFYQLICWLVMGPGIPEPEFFQYPTYPKPTFQISGIPISARPRLFPYLTHYQLFVVSTLLSTTRKIPDSRDFNSRPNPSFFIPEILEPGFSNFGNFRILPNPTFSVIPDPSLMLVHVHMVRKFSMEEKNRKYR